jgi:hypothetical protein
VTVRRHHKGTRGERPRRVRPALALLGLLACLLLLPTATANADVMAKYRTKYKNKLTSYERKMDAEYDFFSATKAACVSTSDIIAAALADPEQQSNIPQLQETALLQRSLLQDAVAETRNAIYANIAAFKATGVKWFRTKADKARFKSRLATMRGGFVQVFSADESLMQSLYLLGTNTDVAGANNEIMAAGMTRITAEDLFERGLKLLRALR